jgi:hypothetical protein
LVWKVSLFEELILGRAVSGFGVWMAVKSDFPSRAVFDNFKVIALVILARPERCRLVEKNGRKDQLLRLGQ